MVGSCDRITPLMLTDWMLEKSENIPAPGALVVFRVVQQIYDYSQHAQNTPGDCYHTNQEVAAAGISLSDGKAESHHRWRHGRVQRPVTVGVVPDVVEDQ